MSAKVKTTTNIGKRQKLRLEVNSYKHRELLIDHMYNVLQSNAFNTQSKEN